MTTNTAPAKRPPEPATGTRPTTIREMLTEMGCRPGCTCRCKRSMCGCHEGNPRAIEPSAAKRAMGARVSIRKAA